MTDTIQPETSAAQESAKDAKQHIEKRSDVRRVWFERFDRPGYPSSTAVYVTFDSEVPRATYEATAAVFEVFGAGATEVRKRNYTVVGFFADDDF